MKRSRTRTHSNIGARMGPAVPPSLVAALRDERATGCNLHSNELRTLDVLHTSEEDGRKEEHEQDETAAASDGDGSAAPPPRTLPRLPDLIELDVSSNRLGGGGAPPPSAGSLASGESLLALCAANLTSLNLSANGLDHDDLARMLSLGAGVGGTSAENGVLVLPNLRTLNLSHNELTRLPQVPGSMTSSTTEESQRSLLAESCPVLSSLSLVGNRIGKLSPLLTGLRSLGATLTELALQGPDDGDENENVGNRACAVEGYQATVLRLLPNVNRLDGREYSVGEREEVLASAELRMLRLEEDEEAEADHRGNENPSGAPRRISGDGDGTSASRRLGTSRVGDDDDGGVTMKKNGRQGGTTTDARILPRRRRAEDPIQGRFSAPTEGGVSRRQPTKHAAETTSGIRARRRASNEPRGVGVDLAAAAATAAASDGSGSATSNTDGASSRMDGLEARLDMLSSIAEEQADATRALLRMRGGSSSVVIERGWETPPPSPRQQDHLGHDVTCVGEEGDPQQYHAWSRHQNWRRQLEVVEDQPAYQKERSQNSNVLEQGVVGNRVVAVHGNKRCTDAQLHRRSVSTSAPPNASLHTTTPYSSPLPQQAEQGAQTVLRASDGVTDDDNDALVTTLAESATSASDIASGDTNGRHRPSAMAVAAAILLVTSSSLRKRRRRKWTKGRALWRWRHRTTELVAAADVADAARRAARRRDKAEVRGRHRRPSEETKSEESARRLGWDEERKMLLVEHRSALDAAEKRCDSNLAEMRERLGRREKEMRHLRAQRDDLARDKGVLEGKCKSLRHNIRRGEKERRRLLYDIKRANAAREGVRDDGDDTKRERARYVRHLEDEITSLKRGVSKERDARVAAETRSQRMVAERDALLGKMKSERLSAYEDDLKVTNAKQAFEEAARRAANDRALRDQATEAGREAVALVREQRNQIQSLQQSVHTLKQGATSSDQERQKLVDERNDLESMLQRRTIEHEKIAKQIKFKDKEIKNLKDAIRRRKKRENELQETARKMEKDLSRIRHERKVIEKQHSSIAGAHKDLEDKVTGLEKELQEVSFKHVPIEKLEDAKEERREREVRHKEEIEKYQLDVKSLQDTICKRDEAIRCLELEKREMHRSHQAKEVAILEQHNLECEQIHKRLQENESEMKEEAHSFDEAMKNMDRSRMEAEKEAKALANELSAERDARKLAENEARRLSAALEKQTSRTKAAIKDLFVQVA